MLPNLATIFELEIYLKILASLINVCFKRYTNCNIRSQLFGSLHALFFKREKLS